MQSITWGLSTHLKRNPNWLGWCGRIDLWPGPHRTDLWNDLIWTLTCSDWPLFGSTFDWIFNWMENNWMLTCSGWPLVRSKLKWRRGNGQFELVAAEGMWSEREAFASFHRVSWGGGGHGGCSFRGKQQYWRRSTLIWIVNLKELNWAMTCSDWPLARTTLNWNVKRSTLIWPDLNFGSVAKTFGQIPSELSFDPLGLTFAQDHTELNFDFN